MLASCANVSHLKLLMTFYIKPIVPFTEKCSVFLKGTLPLFGQLNNNHNSYVINNK